MDGARYGASDVAASPTRATARVAPSKLCSRNRRRTLGGRASGSRHRAGTRRRSHVSPDRAGRRRVHDGRSERFASAIDQAGLPDECVCIPGARRPHDVGRGRVHPHDRRHRRPQDPGGGGAVRQGGRPEETRRSGDPSAGAGRSGDPANGSRPLSGKRPCESGKHHVTALKILTNSDTRVNVALTRPCFTERQFGRR